MVHYSCTMKKKRVTGLETALYGQIATYRVKALSLVARHAMLWPLGGLRARGALTHNMHSSWNPYAVLLYTQKTQKHKNMSTHRPPYCHLVHNPRVHDAHLPMPYPHPHTCSGSTHIAHIETHSPVVDGPSYDLTWERWAGAMLYLLVAFLLLVAVSC